MVVFFRFFVFLTVVSLSVTNTYANEDSPNFVFGLGYGLLDKESLLNIDAKVNMPINDTFSTQVLLNSNYFMTGSAYNSFAESELSSNWFINNDYGRIGLGIGVHEREPVDDRLDSEREVIGQFIGEAFLGDFNLTANYISHEATFNNTTSSRLGASYYLTDDQRVSLYREVFDEEETVWRLETYFQPKKYKQKGSAGIIFRQGTDIWYVGAVIEYYFDHNVSLKQREREFH